MGRGAQVEINRIMASLRPSLLKTADALIGSSLCRLLSRWIAWREPAPDLTRLPAAVRRILVIRPGGMGDMILLLPALDALQKKFPNAHITLVCEQRNADVIQIHGGPLDLLCYDANPLKTLRHLLRNGFDVAIDTEQFHNFSAIIALLSGAKIRIGFKINPRRNPLYTHLINYAPDGYEGDQFLRLLEPLGAARPTALECLLAGRRFDLPPDLATRAGQAMGARPYAIIHAGCSTPYKQWPADRFAAMATALHRESGLGIVLLGTRHDAPVSEKIAALLRDAAVPVFTVCEDRPLPHAAALLQQARLFVGTDSGLAHMATLLDTPSVTLFGPSDDQKWARPTHRHRLVRNALPCAPCFIFGYHKPCRSRACMTAITVPMVLSACREVLASGSRDAR
jgi:ADP-heptose:LPS heptosyltransferase